MGRKQRQRSPSRSHGFRRGPDPRIDDHDTCRAQQESAASAKLRVSFTCPNIPRSLRYGIFSFCGAGLGTWSPTSHWQSRRVVIVSVLDTIPREYCRSSFDGAVQKRQESTESLPCLFKSGPIDRLHFGVRIIVLLAAAAQLAAQVSAARLCNNPAPFQNAVTIAGGFYDGGGLDFQVTVPWIIPSTGACFVPHLLSLAEFLRPLGKVHRFAALGVGNFKGDVRAILKSIAPAVHPPFGFPSTCCRVHHDRRICHVEAKGRWSKHHRIVAPTGRYSGTKLVKWAATVGLSSPNSHIPSAGDIEAPHGYAGVWLYTTNDEFFNGPTTAPQERNTHRLF